MIRIALIRGEKDYISKKQYTYGRNDIYRQGELPDCINRWTDVYGVDYFEFRQRLRDRCLEKFKSGWDYVFQNYEDFCRFLKSGVHDLGDDVMFYSQDDDDLLVINLEHSILREQSTKESTFFEWPFYTALLPHGSVKEFWPEDDITQSNHALLYFKKEDLHLFRNPGLGKLRPAYHGTDETNGVNHLFYHLHWNEFKRSGKTKYCRLPRGKYSLNFLHLSSLSYIREPDAEFGKDVIYKCLETLGRVKVHAFPDMPKSVVDMIEIEYKNLLDVQ